MERGPDKPESVAAIVGFALGMSDAIAISALLYAHRRDLLVKGWVFAAIAILVSVGLLAIKRFRRNPFVRVTVATFVPIAVTATIAQELGWNSDAGRALRGLGLILAFALSFGVALWFSRLKRELDRKVFGESAMVAFFATAAVGVVYGVAQVYMDAPSVSLAWLAIFGFAVFAVSLQIHERKYS